jgi:hypothetical protein
MHTDAMQEGLVSGSSEVYYRAQRSRQGAQSACSTSVSIRLLDKQEVSGSIPLRPTKIRKVAAQEP